MLAYLILSPFALALPAAWLVSRAPRSAGMLAAGPAALSLLLGTELATSGPGGRLVELPWAPSLGLSLSFNLDGLGLLFATLITGIGALIVLYASRYLHDHPHAGRFHASLFAFMGAMLGVVLSDNVLTLFVFWELTGFTSFLLIGFEHERAAARAAALQALIVTGAGGLALLAAGVLLTNVAGTSSLAAMTAARGSIVAGPLYAPIAGLALFAAFTKSAQVPFHFWLPNAMAAPTPVSAYLHSATMVKAGVYLIARLTPILGATPLWTTAVTLAGATTMVIGAVRAMQETDLKRILAYSTLSALGVLTMLLGVGTPEAIVAALVYLLAHAGYKGALFMVAGIIDHETGTRDIRVLRGLGRAMPLTAVAGGAAALSMAGVPLTAGFIGKDAAYEALLHASLWSPWLLILTVLASMLLGLGGLLAGVLPFRGVNAAPAHETHDAPWQLWVPPLVLAVLGLVVGLVPSLLDGTIAAAASRIAAAPVPAAFAAWHGVTPAVVLSGLTLVGVALVYAIRTSLRDRTWRPRRGSEDFYTGGLAALQATSRVVAPALHSASLRTYVMVIVTTTVIVGGGALASHAGLSPAASHTPVAAHDVLIVAVIIGGAIAAALARTTMSAVLALGAVGYGVATMFLSFGAPDLAMTQFSVETLTVLIFVLVFRHFRQVGYLSSRLVRVRDAVIATAVGSFIAALLLSVATTTTAPRLRDFFSESGPTLGHGRNIVNVILVDFRALDTLGEITVLATVAIGVHGLLRLATDGQSGNGGVSPLASSIFRTAARLLMPLLLLFSLFLMLRGHNQPGGGFVGGLVAAAAYALYAIAFGVRLAREALPLKPLTMLGAGLLIALSSGLPAVVRGQPYLTAWWPSSALPLGTPAFFDAGVFLVVTGVVLMMVFSLGEES